MDGFMGALLDETGAQVLALIVGLVVSGVLAVARWWFVRRSPARRTFRYPPNQRVLVVVSESGPVRTDEYCRPTTGIGQVHALLVLADTLANGYQPPRVDDLRLADEALGVENDQNLLLLGGPKTNKVTRRMLEKLDGRLPFRVDGVDIIWDGEAFTGEEDGDDVIRDFGFVVRCANPFDPRTRVVIIGGSHTYGTAAGAVWLDRFGSDRRLAEDLAVLVEAPVVQGHVATPRVVRGPVDLDRAIGVRT